MNTIASFFTGIMTFVSSLLGYESPQSSAQITAPTIEQVVATQEAAQVSTSTTVTSAIVLTSTIAGFKMFHNDFHKNIFDFAIQYPENWKAKEEVGITYLHDTTRKTKDGKNKMVLAIELLDDNKLSEPTIYDNSTSSISSFESWVKANFSDNKIGSLKKITLDGNEAWVLPADKTIDPCYQWILLYRNGLIYSIYRNVGTCDYDKEISSVLSSLKFLDQATTSKFFFRDWTSGYNLYDHEKDKDDESSNLYSRVAYFIQGDPIKTIKRDFSGGGFLMFFYTSNDKNRLFFKVNPERDFGISPCQEFRYFDIKKRTYIEPNVEFCGSLETIDKYNDGNTVEKKLDNPLVIQYGKFDNKDLRVLNLESMKEVIVYSKKNNFESLIYSCEGSLSGDFSVGPMYSNDIQEFGNNKIRIGIYKEVGQDSKPCDDETVVKYEKIRDDFVDLNKL